MIKTGRIDYLGNKLGFISEGNFYIVSFDQYNPNMLGQIFTAEVNSIRKTVVRFLP